MPLDNTDEVALDILICMIKLETDKKQL